VTGLGGGGLEMSFCIGLRGAAIFLGGGESGEGGGEGLGVGVGDL